MEIKTVNPNIAVIKLEGRVDVQKSLELEQEVNKLLANGYIYFVFDLEEVSYISSSCIRVFISTLRKLKEGKGGIKLAKVNPSVKKILKLVDLDNLFEEYESVEKAIEKIQKEAK